MTTSSAPSHPHRPAWRQGLPLGMTLGITALASVGAPLWLVSDPARHGTAPWLALGVALGWLLSLAWLARAYGRFGTQLRHLREDVAATAEGDLAHSIEARGDDELGRIGRAVDGMSARLSAIVANIRSSAEIGRAHV